MDESEDPKPATPPRLPGSPLPRLWKHAPEEDSDAVETEKQLAKAKRKKSKGVDAGDASKGSEAGSKKKSKDSDKTKDGKKGVLAEETPELDTYETRQRIRVMVGVGTLALMLLVSWGMYRYFSRGPTAGEELSEGAMPPPPPAGTSRQQLEQEARILFDRARELAKSGKSNLAVSMLKRVMASYAGTPSSAEAKEALERPAQNLPLFLDRPAVVASADKSAQGAATKERTEAPPKTVVVASATKVAAKSGAEANLVLPANPAEPGTSTTAPAAASAPASANGKPPESDRPSKALPKGFYARRGTKVHESGWPTEIVAERDGAPMMLVPGGTFVQGREEADPAEAPMHRVNVATFYMDKHEVTVRQFNLFQKESAKRSERVRALARDATFSTIDADESKPVVMVTARDAADYAAWAGKRLPTEAQWESAARTPDGRVFPWGNDTESPRDGRQVNPVMAFKKDLNPYGIYDLAGNCHEWTKDWFDPKYYQQFRTTPADNPTGPSARPKSQQLVVKGAGNDWAVSRREGIKFDVRLPYLGFRCVLPVEGPGNALEPSPAAGTPGAPPSAGATGSAVPF